MSEPGVELFDSHDGVVGAVHVRRALPHRGRRSVGPWCFADHMGPVPVTPDHGVDVGPHPHVVPELGQAVRRQRLTATGDEDEPGVGPPLSSRDALVVLALAVLPQGDHHDVG